MKHGEFIEKNGNGDASSGATPCSAKYVDCQCVACGWMDGFKSEAITHGMVGGWCDTCGRETVFRVSKPEENKYASMQDLAVSSFINAARMSEAGHLKQAYMEAESGQRLLKSAIDAISTNEKPRYCHKCKAWHSPTDAGWKAGCE
jgi:NADH pyrophosphatase NudC (nudix superfamily)